MGTFGEGENPYVYPPAVRRAKIRVSLEELHQILDVPYGLHIVGVYGEYDPPSVTAIIEGDELPEIDAGVEAPLIGGHVASEIVVIDGRVFRRWGWSQDD